MFLLLLLLFFFSRRFISLIRTGKLTDQKVQYLKEKKTSVMTRKNKKNVKNRQKTGSQR